MIDIHCHILPGLDDGADDLEASLLIAKKAVQDGITTVIATPHHRNGFYDNPAQLIRSSVAFFNKELFERDIDLHVLPGQEIRVTSHLFTDWDQQKLVTLHDTRYILLELPSNAIPANLEEVFHELSILGLVPIIAHPERNSEIIRNPKRLQTWITLGALCQITSHSITGLFGRKIQKTAMELCRMQMAHFVASDSHKPDIRPHQLKQAYTYISKELGRSFTEYYQQNAMNLVHNELIERREIVDTGKKWFELWRNLSYK